MRLGARQNSLALDCAHCLAMRPTFSPPSEVAEYRIVRLLGRGAMGQVYLAQDTLLDRLVAIKFIASEPSPALRERFLVEARAIARLHHPSVVSIYRVGEHAGRPYLVSEFVRGQSLSELPKPVPLNEALRIGVGLSAGLRAAHQAGVLHRDVKPANAILADGGEAKLLDFGLAKLSPLQVPSGSSLSATESARSSLGSEPISGEEATLTPEAEAKRSGLPLPSADVTLSGPAVDEPFADADVPPTPTPVSLTKTGAWVGTPRYMAPEIFAGEPATTRSDVYSLGALLFELCVGKPPFVESDVTKLAAVVQSQDAPTLLSLIPDEELRLGLSHVVARCLSRDPQARYLDGNELWHALTQLQTTGTDASPVSTDKRFASRRWLLWLATVGAVTSAGLWLWIDPTERSSHRLQALPDAAQRFDQGLSVGKTVPEDLARPEDLTMLHDLGSASLDAALTPRSSSEHLQIPSLKKPKGKLVQPVNPSVKPLSSEDRTKPVLPSPSEPPAPSRSSGPTAQPAVSDPVEIPIER